MSTSSLAESIFDDARRLTNPAERRAYLDLACQDDRELRSRIDLLLSAHAAGEFLEHPPAMLATASAVPIGEQPGDTIGSYKLLEQIGEGGMGLVFMAEQSQPLRRRVALKIIKPGLDTRSVIARFEAERQALALMDHPNIAQVFDAGATESGRPYFVMELVRGAPITEYCQQRRLALRERLELFIEVCHAVGHAHQKGIIHRDVKPTNILVTRTDTTAVPKVIDFGVAKATIQPLTDKTLFTQFSQMIGTPLYMSPEQADPGNQDVDTRSDVYSLGVVLYELLTGTTPFDAERLRSMSHDEMRRIIREEDPPKPSTRATTAAEALSTVATPAQLPRIVSGAALKGDLDWIVMKALDKDRLRRYESPSVLAADISRYLEGEPILARPPSYSDKLSKWSRRHRSLVRASAAALAFVFIGLFIVSAMLANAAEEARNSAQIATRERDEAFKNLYRANVQIAHYDWSFGRVDKALEQLDEVRPRPGGADLRRWEWYYTRALCEQGNLLDGSLIRSAADCPFRLMLRVDGALNTFVDSESGEVRLATTDDVSGYPSEVRLCRGGQRLVCMGGSRIRQSNEVVVYDLASRKRLWRKSFSPVVTTLDVSPDGKHLVAGRRQGRIAVWDVEDGSLLRELQGSEDFAWPPTVRWSSNGDYILACSDSGRAAVWAAANGELVHQWSAPAIRGASPNWTAADFNPNGKRVVIGGRDYLQVWELGTDEPVFRIAAHRGLISFVAWSPDGKSIASCGLADNFVRVWDASSGELENEFRGHTTMIWSIEWLDKGLRLAATTDGHKTKIWRRDEQQRFNRLPAVGAIAWTPSGKLIACGGAKRTHEFELFESAAPKPIQTFGERLADGVLCMAVNSANQRLATGHGDGKLRLWDLSSGKILSEIEVYSHQLRCLSWSPDGSMIATSGGGPEDGFRVVKSPNGEELCRLRIPIDRSTYHQSVSWSPDGTMLAGFRSRDVKMWRTDTWGEVHHFETDDGGEALVQGIAWSPTGNRFACATGEIVTVWKVTTGHEVLRIRTHYRETNSVSWSPDGARLATGGDDHLIKLWDTNTGDGMLTLEGHRSMVRYLSWSPDGRKLASSDGANVLIWDATRGYNPF